MSAHPCGKTHTVFICTEARSFINVPGDGNMLYLGTRIMVYLGTLIMALNVWKYIRFAHSMRRSGDWNKEGQLFSFPVLLLLFFLIGYAAIALFGHPDTVISLILFGGSLFVYVMLYLFAHVTDRIREHEELKARIHAAEEANAAKSYFLSNMSHDIRTPLNAIIGYTTLAKSAPPQALPEYLAKIESAGEQMLTLVNEVLEMSRIENGKLELTPENTNLSQIIQRSADLIRTQMETKGIHFTTVQSIQNHWVICDGPRLSRILMNMLSNAYKFTDKDGNVTLSLIQTGQAHETASYRLEVSDTGIGMSESFVSHVFVPFERERTSTVSKAQGTGLGMSITKSIVDLMGGQITVNSAQGSGTTFTVTLTFPLGEEKSETPDKDLDSTCDTDFTGMKILLVEDNPINREIALMLLTQHGFLVDTAENGAEAVETIRTSPPDTYRAILMDIQMPVMDGYAATRAIRALPDPQRASVPIIALTANAFKEDRQAAMEAGMQAHIAKPLNYDEIAETLRHYR